MNSNACKASSNPAAAQLLLYTSEGDNNNIDDGDGDSDNVLCEWEAGLRLLIVAIVAYAMAGITILILPESTLTPPQEQPRQLQVTYQRTVHPDGTTTVEKVQEPEV